MNSLNNNPYLLDHSTPSGRAELGRCPTREHSPLDEMLIKPQPDAREMGELSPTFKSVERARFMFPVAVGTQREKRVETLPLVT